MGHVLYLLFTACLPLVSCLLWCRKIVQNLEAFKMLSAVVMSYSFTDKKADHLGQTMMVPFVDLLNHSTKNHVELNFHSSCLQLLAVRNICKVRARGVSMRAPSIPSPSLSHTCKCDCVCM